MCLGVVSVERWERRVEKRGWREGKVRGNPWQMSPIGHPASCIKEKCVLIFINDVSSVSASEESR